MKQVAVPGRELDAAEAAALQQAGGLRECGDQDADVVGVESVRHGPAEVIRQGGGPDRIVGAPGVVAAAA